MKIFYKKIFLSIKFEHSIIIKKPVIFSFRSVLGKELKKISCIFKQKKSCEECLINETCPYSFYFESPKFEKGNKKPHPFTLYVDFEVNKKIENIILEFVLIGKKSISYFPYIFYSIIKAGEKGIFKERVKFFPSDVKIDNRSILISEKKLDMNFSPDLWIFDNDLTEYSTKEIKIKFFTPVRIKKHGKICSNIDYFIFLKAIFRRMKFLCEFYGEGDPNNKIDISTIPEVDKENFDFEKVSLNYYSSRQKRRILLIGFTGSIYIRKKFTPFEISLLEASKIFAVGSNTTFGFGKVDYF